MQLTDKPKAILNISISLIVLAAVTIHVFSDSYELENYHGDESNWINTSIFAFQTFVIDRDFSHPDWHRSFRTFGRENPQLGKYIIGSALHYAGFRQYSREPYKYNYRESWRYNQEHGNLPPEPAIYAARTPIAVLAVMTSLIILALGWYMDSLPVGVLASLLFAFNPIATAASQGALTDIPALFFSLASVLWAAWSARALSRFLNKKPATLSGLSGLAVRFCILGLLMGLAISTKMNSLLVLLTVGSSLGGWFVLRTVRHYRMGFTGATKPGREGLILMLLVTIAGLITLLIFIGSNPLLYKNTLDGMEHILSLSQRVTAYRENNPRAALYTWSDKFNAFVRVAMLDNGTLASKLHVRYLDIALIVLSIPVIGKRLWGCLGREDHFAVTLVKVCWILIFVVGMTYWIPLSWKRWYPPVVPPVAYAEAVALVWLLEKACIALYARLKTVLFHDQ